MNQVSLLGSVNNESWKYYVYMALLKYHLTLQMKAFRQYSWLKIHWKAAINLGTQSQVGTMKASGCLCNAKQVFSLNWGPHLGYQTTMNLLQYSSSECCSWYRTSKAWCHVRFALIAISYVWIRSIASLCDWYHGGTTIRQPRWWQTWHHGWGISDWSITVITTEGWVPWSSK